MACRVIGSWAARSVAVAGPRAASSARIPRRLGSAKAAKTSCATASRSGLFIEVCDQLTQLVRPALGVARVGHLVVPGIRQLREPAFDHGQRGAVAGGLQRELHVGASRIAFGKAVDRPGVAEDARRLEALDSEGGSVAAVPGELGLATDAQVDLGAVPEPGAQALGSGQRRPDPLRRVGQLDRARSEEPTSELQSRENLVCRLL